MSRDAKLQFSLYNEMGIFQRLYAKDKPELGLSTVLYKIVGRVCTVYIYIMRLSSSSIHCTHIVTFKTVLKGVRSLQAG